MARFELDASEFERLEKAIKDFPDNAEDAINEVLHGEGSEIIKEEIKRLMPVSGKNWRGKAPAAKHANSLTQQKGNLFVDVKSQKKYNYLYFPDDGSNTRRHAGNQHFFLHGAENKQTEVIDRCVNRLVNSFGE